MACGGSCGCDDCGKRPAGALPGALSPGGLRASVSGCGCEETREPPSFDPRGLPAGAVDLSQLGVPPDARARDRRAAPNLSGDPRAARRVALARAPGAFESLA